MSSNKVRTALQAVPFIEAAQLSNSRNELSEEPGAVQKVTPWGYRPSCGQGGAVFVKVLVVVLVGLCCVQQSVAGEFASGQLSVCVQGVQHTLDALRYGDLRPTMHTDFGGSVEIAYAVRPSIEIAVSGYRGRSHFQHDTGYEKGLWKDSDWTVDVGPNFRLADGRRAVIWVGGAVLYGEARSRLTITDALGSYPFEGPETFLVGGAGRLLATVPLASRLEGVVQLGAGVMKAHAKAPASGNLYEWNAHTFTASLGVRAVLIRGRQKVPDPAAK